MRKLDGTPLTVENGEGFQITPVSGIAGCNSGSAAIGGTNSNVFCPEFTNGDNTLTFTCTTAGLGSNTQDPCYGYAFGTLQILAGSSDTLQFTLDPSTFDITMSGALAPSPRIAFGGQDVLDYDIQDNAKYSPGIATITIPKATLTAKSAPAETTPDLHRN